MSACDEHPFSKWLLVEGARGGAAEMAADEMAAGGLRGSSPPTGGDVEWLKLLE